jgi:Zn-dependent M28 family amino/carboxypeptidase
LLFNGMSPAYDYLLETLRAWYPPDEMPGMIEEDPYQPYPPGSTTWKNLILTIPGSLYPDEVVILSAHFDSTSSDPANAPGAEDNASGSAALLEAARVLRSGGPLARTVRLVWFTGEEQVMLGSRDYLKDPARRAGIVGVINLDMYGFDTDNDGCFELHISSKPDAPYAAPSQQVASCFAASMRAYDIGLPYDTFYSGATRASDHSAFWDYGIGAVEVLENYNANSQPNGCTGADRNPFYHTVNDRVEFINPQTGFEITRAGLAAAFSLANPVPVFRNYFSLVKN